MKCIRNLGYKLKFIFSHPSKTCFNILKTFSCIIGTFSTLFGIVDSIFATSTHFDFLKSKIWWFVIIGAIASILVSINWIPKIEFKINGTDTKLAIKVGNIVNYKKSLVISTNSSFVTTMEDEVISMNSVQGEFQLKYYKNNLSELESLISLSLTANKPIGKLKLKKRDYKTYDIGTVAKIRQENRSVMFLALNHINESGQNNDRNFNDFYTALDRLWSFIRKNGNTEELAIPLIGSGRAGIKEITKEQALEDIIDSYVGISQNYKILTKLTIYIFPKDIGCININKIKKYAENKCLFAKSASPIGKPEQ